MVASERSSKTMSTTLRAVSVKEKAHADHASQMVARLLILSTPRPCAFAPSVTTPLYSTTVSQALRQSLRGSLSERRSADLTKIHLPIEQAIYACMPENGGGFFEGVCGQGNQPFAFRDPPPPPLDSPTALLQPCSKSNMGVYTERSTS